jgi:hypothetical protein
VWRAVWPEPGWSLANWPAVLTFQASIPSGAAVRLEFVELLDFVFAVCVIVALWSRWLRDQCGSGWRRPKHRCAFDGVWVQVRQLKWGCMVWRLNNVIRGGGDRHLRRSGHKQHFLAAQSFVGVKPWWVYSLRRLARSARCGAQIGSDHGER